MRLKRSDSTSPSVRTSSVLPSPGTPSNNTWPPANKAMSTCRTTSRCPTMAFLSSVSMLAARSANASMVRLSSSSRATPTSTLVALEVGKVLPHQLAHGRRHFCAIDIVAPALCVLADDLAVRSRRASDRERLLDCIIIGWPVADASGDEDALARVDGVGRVVLREMGATDTTAGRALCACIRAAVAGSGAATQGAGIDRHGRARKRRAERRLARLTGQWLLRRWLDALCRLRQLRTNVLQPLACRPQGGLGCRRLHRLLQRSGRLLHLRIRGLTRGKCASRVAERIRAARIGSADIRRALQRARQCLTLRLRQLTSALSHRLDGVARSAGVIVLQRITQRSSKWLLAQRLAHRRQRLVAGLRIGVAELLQVLRRPGQHGRGGAFGTRLTELLPRSGEQLVQSLGLLWRQRLRRQGFLTQRVDALRGLLGRQLLCGNLAQHLFHRTRRDQQSQREDRQRGQRQRLEPRESNLELLRRI